MNDLKPICLHVKLLQAYGLITLQFATIWKVFFGCSSKEVLRRRLLLLHQVIFIQLVFDLKRQVIPLPVLSHVHIFLSHSNGLKSLVLLSCSCLLAFLHVFLMIAPILGRFLHFLLLPFSHSELGKFIRLHLVWLLQWELLLFTSQNSHLPVLSYLLQFLLLVGLSCRKLILLLLLVTEVFIPHLLRFAIHDVAFARIHILLLLPISNK